MRNVEERPKKGVTYDVPFIRWAGAGNLGVVQSCAQSISGAEYSHDTRDGLRHHAAVK